MPSKYSGFTKGKTLRMYFSFVRIFRRIVCSRLVCKFTLFSHLGSDFGGTNVMNFFSKIMFSKCVTNTTAVANINNVWYLHYNIVHAGSKSIFCQLNRDSSRYFINVKWVIILTWYSIIRLFILRHSTNHNHNLASNGVNTFKQFLMAGVPRLPSTQHLYCWLFPIKTHSFTPYLILVYHTRSCA